LGRAFSGRVGALFRLDGAADDGTVEVADYHDFAADDDLDVADVPTEPVDADPPPPGIDEPTVTVPDPDADTPGGPYDQDRDAAVFATAAAATGTASQLETDLAGPRTRRAWKLPPRKLLQRAGSQQVDKTAISERGRTLEHALA